MGVLPKISLITPTLNQAATLKTTIESVIVQDYPPHEHLVFDAMSTDRTPKILDAYRSLPFLKVMREPDEGQSEAIDKGIRRSTGEIVGWLNSDDVLLPGALRVVAEAFSRYPEAPVIYGGGFKIDWSGKIIKRVRSTPFDPKLLSRAFYFLQPAMFFRREAYIAVGGLDLNLAYAMDWDLALKLAKIGNFVAIDEDLASLRCHDATKSQTGGWRRAREIAWIGRRHHGLTDRNYLVFLVKSILGKFHSPRIRRKVEGLIHLVCRSPATMIEGWPSGD